MADNTRLSTNIGSGDLLTTKDVTHGGDAGAKLQSVSLMGVSGSEGAYTIADINGDATNGLDVDVTRMAALIAGDAVIGRVKLSDGTDVALITAAGELSVTGAVTNAGTFAVQVDGSALTALQLIDNLVLAEDSAHASLDPGVQVLAVRKATPANLSGADGDYEPLQVSAGRLWVDPSGVTLTVASHAVTNAGTFAVQVDGAALTSLQLIDDAISGTEMQVDVVAALPAGDNNIGNVDIVSGTITTVSALGNSTTGPQKAEDAASANGDVGIPAMAVQKATPANTAGTDGDYEFLQMSAGRLWASATIDAALPAGANAIGKLAANSGVDIGDVDVTSIIPGTGATNLGKAIDSAGGATDTGVAVLAIRDDSLAALTPVEGDYVALRVNSTGALHVTGGGGGTQYNVDDVAGATDTGTLLLAIRDDSLSTLTPVDGDYVGLRVSSTGALHVTGGGGGTEYTVDAAAPAAPTGATFVMERDDALSALTEIEGDWTNPRSSANGALWVSVDGTVTVGSHAVTNAGTFAVQVDGAALTALQLIDNTIVADDAAFTPGTTSVNMAGFQADETATDSVDEGDAGAARMTLDRKVITTLQPHTNGGLTIFRSIDIDESEEEVKATAGVLYSIAAFNRTAAPLYLKFYNLTAANTTVGTSTPVLTFVVPGNADSDGAGFILEKTYGWTFDTAISVACTTGVADADTGAPAANDCVINLGYK